ncbi:protein phosphatase [Lithospermum erythrorhizon]|uniref:Serine/threonine protein phosphatase 2A regulatory subunit n=1 Tax=Lithospermum erythrorhizon TaxID=34254 RepID=A0AAV3PXG9_LITER
MLKQFLSKLPRKSSRAQAIDPGKENCGDPSNSSGSGQALNGPRKTSSAVFPASVIAGIEPLLSFKDVPSSERMNLFISKLSLCCVVFDFTDPTKSVSEKDLKRATLVELVDFVESTNNPPLKFTEPAILAVCKMCSMNLFRAFPPSFRRGGSAHVSESDDAAPPSFDSAWPHLHLVYDLLLKFVTCASLEAKVAKKYINHSFILGLLDLFESEDTRERDILKAILHRIYGKFMVHRPFIRRGISHVFYQFVYETEKHNGIADLLEMFGSVITGFALPLKEEHKMFLWRTLMPLHKPKSLGVYFQQLTFCVTQFIEKDPTLCSGVISLILKYWPITNSQKEVMIIGELEEILEGIHMTEFQEIMVPLFWRIGCCIRSSHFQVAERALFLWNNDQIVDLIVHNLDVILPIILPALESNVQSHWNHGVLNLTVNVRKMFLEMDDELFQACHSEYEEEQQQLNLVAEKREEAWKQLESAPGLQPIGGNIAVLVTTAPSR